MSSSCFARISNIRGFCFVIYLRTVSRFFVFFFFNFFSLHERQVLEKAGGVFYFSRLFFIPSQIQDRAHQTIILGGDVHFKMEISRVSRNRDKSSTG